jgi:hypothetical protein
MTTRRHTEILSKIHYAPGTLQLQPRSTKKMKPSAKLLDPPPEKCRAKLSGSRKAWRASF